MTDEKTGGRAVRSQEDVTHLLACWSEGDEGALERLIAAVADDLRHLARSAMARERIDHTLQPTALVGELYLRLTGQRQSHWENRKQFFGFATTLMRRILTDHARAKQRAKRGGPGAVKVPLEEMRLISNDHVGHVLAVNEALSALAELDPRAANVVELRLFMGLTNPEIARVLGVSLATVKRDWHFGSRWLSRALR